MEKKDLWLLAFTFPIAIYASVARTLAESWGAGKRGLALAGLVMVNAVIAGFCALLVVPLSKILHLDFWWTIFSAGVAGYMGIGFITMAESLFKKRIGENIDGT